MSLKHSIKNLEKKYGGEIKNPKVGEKSVSPRTFLESKEYMNAKGVLYPEVRKAYLELNSGKFSEAVMTGAIGTGKTTLALYTQIYQLYKLSLISNPQKFNHLDPSSEIVIIFQSVTATLTKNVDFACFKEMISRAPYFKNNFQPTSATSSELRFPNRIVVRAGSGLPTAALGQNVIGGLIDEANFMAIHGKSLRTVDGGTYDQASQIYESISRRRKSRFLRNGKVAGILCIASSRRYPDEFTEKLERQARRSDTQMSEQSIFIFDKRLWEVKPIDTYGKAKFKVFIGNNEKQPCVLGKGTDISLFDEHLVIDIPEEFRQEFEVDIYAALRDIAGVATSVICPFIPDKDVIREVFGTHEGILDQDHSYLIDNRPKISIDECRRLEYSRWVHIDLALNSDSAGIACGYVPSFVKMDRGDGVYEILPRIVFDFVLEVPPPKGGEISFEKIRALIILLKESGLPIKWVSTDSYQSKDTQQILRQKGFTTGEQSPDKKPIIYDVLKSAILDRRIYIPSHAKAQKELAELERDAKSGKVDHPPRGSKDLADSIASVAFGLTWRREIWAAHGLCPHKDTPSLSRLAEKFGEQH